ncbi:hypothetical protein HPB51_021642 [Rhipicephalus microplus]|uniref:Uncharacterized protein n=1 Tax=Rhipicephalus microplus TaxID=6941 RepID=A0A9J6EV61_RHIMP|nr:hypothetical protein HPB51_021642 [Rhipicephalus microplus]
MTAQIREALLKLHASQRPDEALTLVEEVDRTCQDQAFSDKDEGYITTLLVSDEKSLVAYLKKSIVYEQLKDAKAKGLQLLTSWFEKVPSHLFNHAVAVKDVSTQLAFRDKAAKVRCAALVLLSKVLESCQGLDVSEKLDIRDLLDRFFILLSQPSKMTPTVKVEVLCVMGVIAEHHPAAANPYSDKLLSLYLGELKMLRKSGEGKERTTLAGCLQGLAGYLHSFGTGFDTEPDDYFLLFSFVKKALVPSPSTTRYDVPRAALILLSKHAALFGQLLLDEHKSLYKQIGYWSHHGNREMKVLGVAALESFLREYFIQEFQQTLKSATNTYNLAAALKGYGLLALPCKQYLKESDVLFMLNDVLLRSEHVFQSISSPAVLEDSLPLLTSFQEATASILRCAAEVPESQLLLVEKLAVLQIENFPLVAEGLRSRYAKSLLFLLLAVHPLSPTSLSQIVYQGLARTCSHSIVADVEASEEDDDGFSGKLQRITYRRYNLLWSYLLEAVNVQASITADARSTFVCNVYDALLSAILSMVSKLNLSVKQSNAEGETGANMSDPTCGVDAECPKDFNIFINLIDFFRDTFLWKHTEYFTKWAFVMIKKFVEYSSRYPLVSGFYKALAVCFQICEKSSYFQSGSSESTTCLCLVSSFVQETMGRLQQFKDDLLASCLELVLRAPSPAAQEQIITRVPALKLQETELEALRRKILDFLGSLNGERRAFLMADLEKETLAAALTWDPETKEHLLFAVPFPDAKIDISFDGFLPRVVELARFAGNRQTKVAACELLHALVLYAVGTGVQNTERRAKCPMVHLYQHLFPELLHLSCDPDQPPQPGLNPATCRTQSRSRKETTVRDFAAQCLKEFVAWSIKQSSSKELEKSPTNVKSVLGRLCSYCRHPSASKRLGAALVFNNIYSLVREEESLVDIFILETLAYFVDSLKLAHADEKTIGTRQLCCRALDKLLRIISSKSGLLSNTKTKRRWPLFEAGLSAVSGTWTNLTSIRKFCDHLLGLLECYTWILEQQLLEPKLLFEVPGQPSAIFPLVTTFLEKLALCENLQEALDSEHAASLPCTPARTSALNVVKCSLTVRLFNFLTVWMRTCPSSMSSVPDAFWKIEAFWKCCVVCVLRPSEAGFDLADLEVANQLPHEAQLRTAELMDVEIVAEATAEQPNEDSAEVDPASADGAPLPTSAEVVAALALVRRHCGAIEGTGLSLMDRLNYIEDAVVKHAMANKKQATLFQYFKPTQ